MGPLKQVRTMFASTRLIATCIVILSFIMTLVAAIVVRMPFIANFIEFYDKFYSFLQYIAS